MRQWRWRIAGLLALLPVGFASARKSAGGGGDFLSAVSGTYTHVLEEDLQVTIAYDLQDDSSVPFSYVTG